MTGDLAMSDPTAALEAVRQVVRDELRRCGIRPPSPPGPGRVELERRGRRLDRSPPA